MSLTNIQHFSVDWGTFKGEYTIHLKPDAQLFSLLTPRNVPIPLCEKVAQELQRMESLGVISRVTEPTQRCAAMRICPYLCRF